MSAPHNLSPAEAYRHDLKGYLTGFVLAVVLTVIPFAMVAKGGMSFNTVIGTIVVLGLIQVVVHVRYFLHVDLSPERREDLYIILFSALLLFIMAAGTIWILANLQDRMMGGVDMGTMHMESGSAGSSMSGMQMNGTTMKMDGAAKN